MKLIDGIKYEGCPFEIPDNSRDELPEFLKEMGYKVGVEIGVYKGEFTKKFLDVGLKIYAIDPWQPYEGAGRTQKNKARQDFLYGHTQRYLDTYIKNGQCLLIRETSMNALKFFDNESLDFVYIDGDHRFRYIAEDIYEWSFKVKKNGIISGHDYFCTDPTANNVICQVKPIIDAYVRAFGVKNFYIFGRSKPIELEKKNDKYYSWMLIKQ